jgi:hypothetical protein
MVINGKERGFLLTIGASAEISELCPQGDLSRLGEVFNQSYAKQIRITARLIAAMSRGYENQKHYEDPSYEPDALTVDEIMTLDTATFQELTHEVMQKFGSDQQPTVETEAKKNEVSAT